MKFKVIRKVAVSQKKVLLCFNQLGGPHITRFVHPCSSLFVKVIHSSALTFTQFSLPPSNSLLYQVWQRVRFL